MVKILTENYCDDCDDVLHAVFDEKDFYSHKVGRIECKCGRIVKPCNECEDHGACSNCPWENAEVTKAMTDLDFMTWIKNNEPKTYEIFRNGQMGDYYAELIKNMEKGC